MNPSKYKTQDQLDNLIGRPLVPFFIEGNNGTTVENASLKLDKNQIAYEFDNALTVREFKDGYFQNAHVVRGASSLPGSPTKNSKRGNRQNKQHTGVQRSANGSSGARHQKSPKARQASRKGAANGAKQTHWAGGAYLNSPSPQLVPLPAFVGSKSHNENSSRAANANTTNMSTDSPPLKAKNNKNNKNNKTKNTNNVTHPSTIDEGNTTINKNVLSFFDAYNASLSPSGACTTPPVRATSVSAGSSPLLLGTPVTARSSVAARSLATENAGAFLLKLVKGGAEIPQPLQSSPPAPSPALLFRTLHGVTSIPIAASS